MLKAYIYLFILSFLAQACSVFEEPEEFTLVNIGTDYIIELSQTLQLGSNAMLFNIKTTQMDNCIDSHIDVESKIIENQLQLILGDIITHNPCLQIPNQLESSAKFTLSTRDYDINISLKDVIQNFGTVSVSDESFTIELETENGIIIGQQKINIIPDDYIWGRIGISDINNKSQLKNIVKHIQSINQPHALKDGNYSFFEIREATLSLPRSTEKLIAEEEFLVRQTADFEIIKNSLAQFSEQFPEAKIQIMNSVGESILN